MKRSSVLIFSLGAVLALVLAGCGATANVPAGPPVVETALVARGRLASSSQVSGKLEPVQVADLFTEVVGRVTAVNVNVGSVVTKGQVLLTLDSSTQAAALKQAEVGVGTARASLAEAQASLAEAQAGEKVDEINYDTLKADYERGQALLAQGAISPNQFDNQYKLPYQQAETDVNQVDPAKIAAAQAGVQAAQAGVQAAQAGVRTAQAAYNETILTAPFNGIITARNIDPGAMSAGPPAVPGGTPLLVEVQLDPIYVNVNVDGDQVNGLTVGEQAKVTVTGASDRVLTGTISHVAVAANPSTKTYLVQITLPNPGDKLKPGMFADVTFHENNAGYLLVPNQAVLHNGSVTTVWVVKDGRAEQRTVQLGASDGVHTIVDAGLQAGDRVIISGQQGLTPGEKVTVRGS